MMVCLSRAFPCFPCGQGRDGREAGNAVFLVGYGPEASRHHANLDGVVGANVANHTESQNAAAKRAEPAISLGR